MHQYNIKNLDEMKAKIALITSDIKNNHSLNEEKYFEVRLIITELLMNAFKHSKNDYFVDVFIDDNHSADEIKIIVEDYGKGFNVEEKTNDAKSYDLYKSNGRGLKLISALCEKVSYNDVGNSVSIVIKV